MRGGCWSKGVPPIVTVCKPSILGSTFLGQRRWLAFWRHFWRWLSPNSLCPTCAASCGCGPVRDRWACGRLSVSVYLILPRWLTIICIFVCVVSHLGQSAMRLAPPRFRCGTKSLTPPGDRFVWVTPVPPRWLPDGSRSSTPSRPTRGLN